MIVCTGYTEKNILNAGNIKYFLLAVLIFFMSGEISAQISGLGFSSHADLKENRTRLDLNPNHFFSFRGDFTISFSMMLRQNEPAYFGYIIRIIDDKNENTDLIYTFHSGNRSRFDLVFGKEADNKSVPSDFNRICSDWVNIKLEYDYSKKELRFFNTDNSVTASPVHFSSRIKILFGASDYESFKTTDVPPMNIKDIRLIQGGRELHHWPLDESAGNIAFDAKGKINALASHPVWLKPRFQNWIRTFDGNVEGFAEVAFNDSDELIYIIGDDQLIVYSARNDQADTVKYQNKPTVLKQGCQAFYNPNRDVLVSYNLDLKTISTLDPHTGLWDETVAQAYPLTVYWHHNKYFSRKDSILYTIGGYGQHEYKHSIFSYSYMFNRWDSMATDPEIFHPRYLAAMGNIKDTLYILGGFGSLYGKQIMNPRIYNDLFLIQPRTGYFSFKYNVTFPLADIAFANSMVIEPQSREFYVLAFPFFRYESFLQLMKGSLDKPGLIPAGNKIPYMFHDILSYSDLFYCRSGRKLACITLLNNDHQTQVRIYTIGYPPGQEIKLVKKSSLKTFFLAAGLVLLAAIIIVIFILNKRSAFKPKVSSAKVKALFLSEDSPGEKQIAVQDKKNCILFFGDFQIFNRTGEDITNKFSHLLKELFLFIWFHSIRNKGVSSGRITELLWFNKDEKSARNNLSVNLVKLKILIRELDSLELSRETGYWKINFNDKVIYNDYLECLKISESDELMGKDQIRELLKITQKGHFLESSSFEWLDEYKAGISNIVIDSLLKYAEQTSMETDPDFMLHLADSVLNFDMLSEEAIQLKCQVLTYEGKHNLAKESFLKFVKDYKNLYNVEYSKTLADILKR